MKKLFLIVLLVLISSMSFSQFSDTASLGSYIRDTIKDRRPEKVTASQIQKALLGTKSLIVPKSKVWGTEGNGSTVPGTDFIGTTDDKDLYFKINNYHSGLIPYSVISPVTGQPASKGTHFGFAAGAYAASINFHSGTYFGNGAGMYGGDSTSANVFIGNKAGMLHQVGGIFGGRNVGVGDYTQFGSVKGYDNSSLGIFTLNQNFSGYGNSAFGRDALKSSIDGNGNSAFGSYSLWHNSTGVVGASITSGGSGYTTATVTFPAAPYASNGGTCQQTATGTAVISGGQIVDIIITNPGCGYLSYASQYSMNKLGFAYTWAIDSNIVITGDGTGATAKIIVGSGEGNNAFGVYAGTYRRLSYYDTYVGYQSGHTLRYRDSLNNFFGYGTDVDASVSLTTNIQKSTAIGYNAKVGASKVIVLGATGSDQPNVGIGTISPAYPLDVSVSTGARIDGILIDGKAFYATPTAIGDSTFSNFNSGMAIGPNAGRFMTGVMSTAVGAYSQGGRATNMAHNTSVGAFTLANATTSGNYGNSAFGSNSMAQVPTLSVSSAYGAYSMYNVSAVGTNGVALRGITSLGSFSMSGSNTAGEYSTFVGYQAGSSTTGGSFNTGMGALVLGAGGFLSPAGGTAAFNGSHNAVFGSSSMFTATTASYCSVLGRYALANITSGNYNVAIGYGSGNSLTTEIGNVVIGSNNGSRLIGLNNQILVADGEGNERFSSDQNSNFTIEGKTIRIKTTHTPTSATDTGSAGQIAWDANYIYVCIATNTWVRSALSTW